VRGEFREIVSTMLMNINDLEKEAMKRLLTMPLILVLFFLGCGGDDSPPAGENNLAADMSAADGSSREDMSGGDTGGDAAVAPDEGTACIDVEFTDPATIDMSGAAGCGGSWIATLSGTVVDETGAGVPNAMMQLCVYGDGPEPRLKCLIPVDTGCEGEFEIPIGETDRCITGATIRSLVPQQNTSTAYCHVDLTRASATMELSDPVVLFDTVSATEVPPLGENNEREAARTVVFEDGLEIDFIPKEWFANQSSDYNLLAVRSIDPSATGLCFLSTPVDALYAFSPEGDVTNEGFPIRFPNAQSLAAGAKVDLYMLGGLDCHTGDGTKIHEGDWEKYGTATVSADGTKIESDDGSGLACTTWIGYKAQ
jgi:hypothetical protein